MNKTKEKFVFIFQKWQRFNMLFHDIYISMAQFREFLSFVCNKHSGIICWLSDFEAM